MRGSGNCHNTKGLEIPAHKQSVVFVNGKSFSSILQHRKYGTKGKVEFRCSEYIVQKKKEFCERPHSGDATKSKFINNEESIDGSSGTLCERRNYTRWVVGPAMC